jgi:ribosomal protein S14
VTGTAPAPTPILTATDRCDRCGAQAYVRVVMPGGGDLMFCRHHARAHGDKLGEVAVEIHDESDQLDLSTTRG